MWDKKEKHREKDLCHLANQEEKQMAKIERRNKLHAASRDLLKGLEDIIKYFENREAFMDLEEINLYEKTKAIIKKATE